MNDSLLTPPKYLRYLILFLVSVAMFGNYYIYDSISPVADLLAKQLNFSDSNIGLLNAIYSLPNLVMVVIGGVIIDKLGTRLSSFIFAFLCLIGAVVTTIEGSLAVMATGRLIFGLGAESLIVAATTVIGKWFRGKELSFAFGLNISIARLGTIAAVNSPTWAQSLYANWREPLLISIAAGVISVLAVILYWGIDKSSQKKYSISDEEQEKINFKELFAFSKSYWLLVILCFTFYSAVFPFKTFAIKFFMEYHNTTREFGGFLSGTLDTTTIILTPLFGLFSDYIGKRSIFLLIGSFLLIPVFLLLGNNEISLIIPMALLGISYSLIPAVIWPSVAIITPQAKLGTAYGVMTMIQAIGLTGFNFSIGYLNDSTGSFQSSLYLLTLLGVLGVVASVLLGKVERLKKTQSLETPTAR